MRILGIDPGITGGIACIDTNDASYGVEDLPVQRDKKLSWIDGLLLTDQLKRFAPTVAVIERVSALPRQSSQSGFHFGMGFGSILSILQANHLPIVLVTPASWKKALGLSSDKKVSLAKARLLFPYADLTLAKHDGRAEALLLAYWWWQRPDRAPVEID